MAVLVTTTTCPFSMENTVAADPPLAVEAAVAPTALPVGSGVASAASSGVEVVVDDEKLKGKIDGKSRVNL